MTASELTRKVLHWHDIHGRHDLPWNQEEDPYKIWVSEIILQQTRVDQGLKYYLRFISQLPNIEKLANEKEDVVLKLWEGLGYYSRARNLHKGAQYVLEVYDGTLPSDYEALLTIPGIGPYTAAAIASFSFHLPIPVVDGNVLRVMTRVFGITDSIQTSAVVREVRQRSEVLISKHHPAEYNRAIMDIGSLVCKPKAPHCETCPLKEHCVALKNQWVADIPYKHKQIERKVRTLAYRLEIQKGRLQIIKRTKNDIWKGLYTLMEETQRSDLRPLIFETTHLLTHQILKIKVYSNEIQSAQARKVVQETLQAHSFPTPLRKFLEQWTAKKERFPQG